jgi:hypothetical protein
MVVADEVFNAPTATEWKAKILQRTSHTALPKALQSISQFNHYIFLQNISARVVEEHSRGMLHLGTEEYKRCFNDLMTWHSAFEEQLQRSTEKDAFDLTSLWHAIFVSLLVDFSKLERALGRDGPNSIYLEADIAYAVNWSISVAADRCVLHAFAIQNMLRQMSLSAEPAMHVPHCAFLAGIVSYSCLRFRKPAMHARYPAQDQPSSSQSPSDFPEFNINGELDRSPLFENLPVLFENEGDLFMRTFAPQRPVMMVGGELFRQCAEVLQRLGHFEIARCYFKTLKSLIYVEVEKWMHG